jgi:hypothetical protein
MSWLKRHAAWIWPVSLAVAAALVLLLRIFPGWPAQPAPGAAGERGGVVSGDSTNLAATARQLRVLQEQVGRTRDQLAGFDAEAAARRRRVAALDDMLAGNSLTDCPSFLQEDTSVRALQTIIREASESAGGTGRQDQLITAATVARERLRSKLELLRDQLLREIADFDARSEALRARLIQESEDSERIQRLLQRELQVLPQTKSGPTR